MSACEKSDVCPAFAARSKSPLTMAIYICLAIAIVLPALLPLLDGYALERAVADRTVAPKASVSEAIQRIGGLLVAGR